MKRSTKLVFSLILFFAYMVSTDRNEHFNYINVQPHEIFRSVANAKSIKSSNEDLNSELQEKVCLQQKKISELESQINDYVNQFEKLSKIMNELEEKYSNNKTVVTNYSLPAPTIGAITPNFNPIKSNINSIYYSYYNPIDEQYKQSQQAIYNNNFAYTPTIPSFYDYFSLLPEKQAPIIINHYQTAAPAAPNAPVTEINNQIPSNYSFQRFDFGTSPLIVPNANITPNSNYLIHMDPLNLNNQSFDFSAPLINKPNQLRI